MKNLPQSRSSDSWLPSISTRKLPCSGAGALRRAIIAFSLIIIDGLSFKQGQIAKLDLETLKALSNSDCIPEARF